MTQVAADALGLPLDAVRFEVGDTDLPNTSSAVGSAGADDGQRRGARRRRPRCATS